MVLLPCVPGRDFLKVRQEKCNLVLKCSFTVTKNFIFVGFSLELLDAEGVFGPDFDRSTRTHNSNLGICGRRPLWQTTTIWYQNSLVAKCIIPLLLFCQNLGQIGPVVQEKTPKKTKLATTLDMPRGR